MWERGYMIAQIIKFSVTLRCKSAIGIISRLAKVVQGARRAYQDFADKASALRLAKLSITALSEPFCWTSLVNVVR